MAITERQNDSVGSQNITELLALFLSGRIKKEDLSENNIVILDYYHGLMLDDPKFASIVRASMRTIQERGIKTELFSKEELRNTVRHRKRRKHSSERAFQPELWQTISAVSPVFHEPGEVIDPERNIFRQMAKIDSRFQPGKNTILSEEVRQKKLELRNMIDLPVAKGDNPHIKDDFYKYLVRRICNLDYFHIFEEYDRVTGEIPEELQERIIEVKNLVDAVLDPTLRRGEQFDRFNEFVEVHREEWNIVDYRRE